GTASHPPADPSAPPRGPGVQFTGKLADPYGQLEIRPSSSGFRVVGSGLLPAPRDIDELTLGESTEGSLVRVAGIVTGKPTKASSGDITFFLDAVGGPVRIVADASSGLTATSVVVGATYDVNGVPGHRAPAQRAPR